MSKASAARWGLSFSSRALGNLGVPLADAIFILTSNERRCLDQLGLQVNGNPLDAAAGMSDAEHAYLNRKITAIS